MNPYYQDEAVTLYHADSRDVLPTLEDRSVDCIITDPPYSEHTQRNARSNNSRAPSGGRVLDGYKSTFQPWTDADLELAFAEFSRITRGWVVSNLDHRHAFGMETMPPPGLRLMRIGVWVKTNPMPSLTGDRPGMGWEAMVYLHRDDVAPSWNGGGKCANYVGPTAQGSGHPTKKPEPLVRSWVLNFTNAGDLILDPFAGSGTTLRMAKDEGRRAVGYEAREEFCELTARSLTQEVLFA